MSLTFGPWHLVPQKILGPRRLSTCRPDRSKGSPPTWRSWRERPTSVWLSAEATQSLPLGEEKTGPRGG